jgi:hypothetical protein
VDGGGFVSFPGRESKANDQKLKEWPQPCDTTNFCNRIPPEADIALVRTLGAFNHAFTVRAAKAEQRLELDNIV